MPTILVLDGHPNPSSLTAAFAQRYARGAEAAGGDLAVTTLALRDLDFDPILHGGYRGTQPLEPDLGHAQRLLADCDHLALFSPLWWGSTPALLKGFFDRTFESKWAYHYEGPIPKGHLGGRSARFLMSTDSPRWYLALLQGQPTKRQVIRSTLRFSGLGPVAFTRFGPIRTSDAADRTGWLDEAQRLGGADARRLLGRRGTTPKQDPFAIRDELLASTTPASATPVAAPTTHAAPTPPSGAEAPAAAATARA